MAPLFEQENPDLEEGLIAFCLVEGCALPKLWVNPEEEVLWNGNSEKYEAAVFLGFEWELKRLHLSIFLKAGVKYIVLAHAERGWCRIGIKSLLVNRVLHSFRHKLTYLLDKWALSCEESKQVRFYRVIFEYSLAHRRSKLEQLLRKKTGYSTWRDSYMLSINSLALGGAEKQAMVTVNGLLEKTKNVQLLFNTNFFMEEESYICEGDFPQVKRIYKFNEPFSRVDFISLAKEHHEILSHIPVELHYTILRNLKILRKEKPRILHIWLDAAALQVGLAALICGVPKIVISFRSTAPYRYFPHWSRAWKMIYQLYGHLSNVVLSANSAAAARDYEKWLGLNHGHIAVIPNGVSFTTKKDNVERQIERRENLAGCVQTKLVGGLFRLEGVKDPLLWLDVAKYVSDRGPMVKFLMKGSGELQGAVSEKINKLGLNEVVFMEEQSREVNSFYDLIDVMLLTSSREGLPNVLLEAQFHGVPVVAPDVGGCGETFVDRVTGILAVERTVECLGDSLLQILNGNLIRQQTKEIGPQFINENYSVQGMLEKTMRLYED